MRSFLLVALLVQLVHLGTADAEVPTLLGFQGRLEDTSGTPMRGTTSVGFRIYTSSTGGVPITSETDQVTFDDRGVFVTTLGDGVPLDPADFDQQLWVGVIVDEAGGGQELQDRLPLRAAPYALRAASAGGASFLRWGRSTCPSPTTTIYSGYAAGTYYSDQGGGNLLCLTDTPEWGAYDDTSNFNSAQIYGTEFELDGRGLTGLEGVHDKEVRCAACIDEGADTAIMIPGTNSCPAGWNERYDGYLMSNHNTHSGVGEYLCVDGSPEDFGSPDNQNGHLLYPVEANCGALPCAPYVNKRELTCVVCTK